MKKIILILILALTATFTVACNKGKESVSKESQSSSVAQSTQTSTVESTQTSTVESTSTSESASHTHNYVKHEAVAPSCDSDGNEEYYTCSSCSVVFDAEKKVIESAPILNASHSYQLKSEKPGTCSTKGTIKHYECSECHKLFDLTKNEITSIDGSYDLSNHAEVEVLSVVANPQKVAYKVGEVFDPTGLVVVCKCNSCEGEIVDNASLVYEYKTEGETAFKISDTAVTVCLGNLKVDVAVTVEKQTVEITGVLDSYTTACATAPQIEASLSNPEFDVIVEYFDEENNLVVPTEFVDGSTYTARVYADVTGREDEIVSDVVTAEIIVEHNYVQTSDSQDKNLLFLACACLDKKDFFVLNNKVVYVDNEVDDADMAIDLSKLVFGAEDISVTSIMQVKEHDLVAIEGENDGLVYTYSIDCYEDHTPKKLTLAITLEIEGAVFDITLTSLCIDKVIKNVEDLSVLAYTGGPDEGNGGVAVEAYYALACDIDATGFETNASPAWEAKVGFKGTFDGQGYTISNLTVTSWTNGLFGAIGEGAVIKNLSLKNVIVPVEATANNGTYVFAFAIRNATLSNVSISFSHDSLAFKLANEINDTVLENVSIYTAKGHDASFGAKNCEGEINYEYMPCATVTFDTDGGNEIAPVEVISGKKIARPEDPTKASDEVDYVFIGWFINGEEFDFDTVITEDIILVAGWDEKEKVNVEELVSGVKSKIDVLPNSVTMPDHTFFVSRILDAKKAYDELPEDVRGQVDNYAKLESLLANISGYESVFAPSLNNTSVIPAYVPNYTATVGGTGSVREDELYGNVFTATSDANGRASIVFNSFPNVSKYSTLYIWVRVVGASCDIYLSDGIVNDGWGSDWKNTWSVEGFWVNDGNWICKAVDVSTGIFKSEWSLGVRTNTNGVIIEVADIVGVCKPAKADVKTGLTFGNFVNSGATNEHGVVYNFTQGWASDADMGAFNSNALSGAVDPDHNALRFWIYNPNSVDVEFKFTGDMNGWNPQGDQVTVLKAGEWTEVVITPEIIALGNNGTWFVGVTTGAGTSGWQISAIYSFYLA